MPMIVLAVQAIKGRGVAFYSRAVTVACNASPLDISQSPEKRRRIGENNNRGREDVADTKTIYLFIYFDASLLVNEFGLLFLLAEMVLNLMGVIRKGGKQRGPFLPKKMFSRRWF